MLVVEALRAAYGDDVVLEGIDLQLAPGEVVGLLGPSGAGKSTLLRSIVGLMPPTSGRVLLDGVDQRDIPVHRRGIGLMLQEGMLFPHLDVAGNVGYGLRIQGMDRSGIDVRVEDVLNLVHLGGMGARRVETLSGGQRQRVALARSIAPSPRLLLLDEPFGALDLVMRSRLVEDVQELVRELGLTVLAVSHDRNEAFTWCDRVAVMDAGRLVQVAAPSELMRRPATRLVAGLMGMRTVPGEVFGEPDVDWALRPWLVGIEVGGPGRGGVAPGPRCACEVTGRTPLGDRVRLSLHPAGWPDDVVLDAETDWEGAAAIGAHVVAVVPEAAVSRFPRQGSSVVV